MDFPNNLWDLSGSTLPQQVTNIDDSDFLSILSKQLNPSGPPASAHVLAQQINQQQGVSPPVSEESSPSPPTTTNRGLAKSSDAAAAAAGTNDMQHKRKKIQRDESEESSSDDDHPPSKSQKDQTSKKSGKRKSTGADEGRALKRKEQNRAAQRAFRERKEKHVRDLEDQVSALETKSTAQATENENLRELLGRLQNENLMLKQSAFTFNFNSAQTPRSTTTPSRTTPSTATSPIDKSPSTAIGPISKDSNSQSSAAASTSNATGYTPLLSFSSLGGNAENLISMGSPPSTTLNSNSSPLTFFSPPPANVVPSPYTTLASNPMYTSYTDFSAWDQFFQNAALDQTLAGVGSDPSLVTQANPSTGSTRMEDLLTTTDNFSELIPFSSFSPTSNRANSNMMTGLSPSSNTGNSPIDHVATSAKAAHQQQHSVNNAFSLASREASASNRPSLPVRSGSPCGGADPDEAPLPGSAHHNPNMTGMNIAKANKLPGTEHDKSQCPKSKEDFAKMIEQQPVSTLGSVAGIPHPFTEKKTKKLKEVWNALRNHPRFEECDMDELCRELSSKVKCDGGMPGLDESDKPCEELSKLIDAVRAKKAEEAKAAQQVKQQQRVIQSISTGGLPEATMNTSPLTGSTANPTATPNMMNNFSLFANSPYSSYLPFAMPQSASSTTTSGFTMPPPPPSSATTADFGFDSRRPSLGNTLNNGSSSGGEDLSSFMSSSSSNVATPASHGADGSTPIMMDSTGGGGSLSQALVGGTGATDSWLAGAFEMPSPGTQFMSFLNASSGAGGGFSPNSYLNIPDKE